MTDVMRAEFEAWAVRGLDAASPRWKDCVEPFDRDHNGNMQSPFYRHALTQAAWLAWQAAKRTQPGYAAGIAAAAKAICYGCKSGWLVGYDEQDKEHRTLMHYCPENKPGKPGHVCQAAAIRTLSPEPEAAVVEKNDGR